MKRIFFANSPLSNFKAILKSRRSRHLICGFSKKYYTFPKVHILSKKSKNIPNYKREQRLKGLKIMKKFEMFQTFS